MTRLVFLDTETTGLDPDRHEVWEVAWIVRDVLPLGSCWSAQTRDIEQAWQVPTAHLETADPYALRVGRFWDRFDAWAEPLSMTGDGNARTSRFIVAGALAKALDGATVVGAVPDFDVRFLTRWLGGFGFPWTAHYHLCDVENLAVGFLRAKLPTLSRDRLTGDAYSAHEALSRILAPPWSSGALSEALGVEIDPADRHTALGDARWARDVYDAVMSS